MARDGEELCQGGGPVEANTAWPFASCVVRSRAGGGRGEICVGCGAVVDMVE